jgi:peptidoglycan/xylan/chitin deacetylase (PgdA/CDA1 family)
LRFGGQRQDLPQVPGPLILVYHGVVDRIQDPQLDRWAITHAELTRHLDFLARTFQIVPLNRIVSALAEGSSLSPDWVAITFDDALANVYRNARPLLRERRLPYAVAVPTGLVGTGHTIWPMEVRLILLRSHQPVLRLPLTAGFETIYGHRRKTREAAAQRLWAELRVAADADRQQRLALLHEELAPGEFDYLMEEYSELQVMNLVQLQKLHAEGVALMAHGSLHSRMVEGETTAVLHREIAGSKAELEGMIHAPVEYYVYPHGAVTSGARALVRASGYRAALTMRVGCVQPSTNPFELPRIATECTVGYLRQQLVHLAGTDGSQESLNRGEESGVQSSSS